MLQMETLFSANDIGIRMLSAKIIRGNNLDGPEVYSNVQDFRELVIEKLFDEDFEVGLDTMGRDF